MVTTAVHTFSTVIKNMWIHNYILPYVVNAWDLVTASVKLTFLVALDNVGTVNISTERPAFD
jgi:urea transporter